MGEEGCVLGPGWAFEGGGGGPAIPNIQRRIFLVWGGSPRERGNNRCQVHVLWVTDLHVDRGHLCQGSGRGVCDTPCVMDMHASRLQNFLPTPGKMVPANSAFFP